MANQEEQKSATATERMRARYAAGDFKGARAEAWTVLHDGNASEADRAEARRLRENTEVDKRAWAVAGLAIALALVVVVFFLL